MAAHLTLYLTPEVFFCSDSLADSGIERFVTNTCTSMAANLKAFFMAHPQWAQTAYENVDVLIETERYTLVPLSFYETDKAEAWFEATMERQEEELISSNMLPRCDTACVFAIDRFVRSRILELFPDASIRCHTTASVEHFASLNRSEGLTELYVYLSGCRVYAYAYRRGELLTAPAFHAQSIDDVIYFILSLFRGTELDERTHALYLTGKSPFMEEAVARAGKFVREVHELPFIDMGYFMATHPMQKQQSDEKVAKEYPISHNPTT